MHEKQFRENRLRSLIEITEYFLRVGLTGFGGPLALMATFQRDLVGERRWLSNERFARALLLIKALPGPTATQLAIFLGQVRGGRWGGLLAGSALILPSFLMMVGLAAGYGVVNSSHLLKTIFFGMQAAALGVIAQSLVQLARPYRRTLPFWAMAGMAGVGSALYPSAEPLWIVGAGLLGLGVGAGGMTGRKPGGNPPRRDSASGGRAQNNKYYLFSPFLAAAPVAFSATTTAVATTSTTTSFAAVFTTHPALSALAWIALKSGAFVFGTGLAIIPLLLHDVVDVHHWMTHAEFLDALALGQITPGPVVISMSFIGYRVAGIAGALIATVCIFLPGFLNILTWFSWAERRYGDTAAAQRFVQWAVGAVVGSIAVSIGRLALSMEHLSTAVSIGMGTFLLATFTRVPVWILIPVLGPLAAVYTLHR